MKLGVISGNLGRIPDKFIREGYQEDVTFAEKIAALSRFPSVRGVELAYLPGGEEADYIEVSRILRDHGLETIAVSAGVSNQVQFRYGSLANPDAAIRAEAVDLCKRSMDYAAELGSGMMTIWPGQDGFDYPFQTDYTRQYDHFLEGLAQVARHNPAMKVAIEYKWREPRLRLLADSASTILLMAAESGCDNAGACIDIGHVLMANGNMAKDVEACAKRGRLFYLHINDCYGYWDDDMPVGTVRFVEYLELLHALRRVGYGGWYSVDICPFRDDGFRCVEESLEYWAMFDRMVDKIGVERLDALKDTNDTMGIYRLMRENLFR